MNDGRLWYVTVDSQFQGIYERAAAMRIADELYAQLPDAIVLMTRADEWPQAPMSWNGERE